MNIWEIRDQLGLKKYNTNTSKDGYEYRGVISTGYFEAIHDYNTGLLDLTFRNPTELKYPFVIITTIDDGVWQGYGNKYIDINKLVKDFKNNFDLKLPSEKDFNNFLNNYGICGTFTG